MDTQLEFEALRRESSSWWSIARRKLLCEAVAQAINGKRDARVLDLGCAAQLSDTDSIRTLNAHNSLITLAFRQIEGLSNLICTGLEDLGFVSNSFDAVVAGDILQMVPDDHASGAIYVFDRQHDQWYMLSFEECEDRFTPEKFDRAFSNYDLFRLVEQPCLLISELQPANA